jgi:hypothetical protein
MRVPQVPAHRQKSLFDYQSEAERALHDLEVSRAHAEAAIMRLPYPTLLDYTSEPYTTRIELGQTVDDTQPATLISQRKPSVRT